MTKFKWCTDCKYNTFSGCSHPDADECKHGGLWTPDWFKDHEVKHPVLEVECDTTMSLEECEKQISKLYKSRTNAMTIQN